MAQILFKRLFEVRIQHGYYLDYWFTDPDTDDRLSFYEFKTPEIQQAFVLENKYKLALDLNINPSAETALALKNANLRWRALPTGFVVGMEVAAQGQGTNTRFYPVRTLPENATWSFLITLNNAFYYNITNHAFRPTLPGKYYFTNLRSEEDGKVFPSLSTALPSFSPDRSWEMGEHVLDNSTVKVATQTSSNAAAFAPIVPHPEGSRWPFYAHSGDRVALPKVFNYRFDSIFNAANPVTQAEFTLFDADNNERFKIFRNYPAAGPIPNECPLDFRYPSGSKGAVLSDGWYRLEVKINGSVFETRNILLRSDLSTQDRVFGLIEISTGVTGTPFTLFQSDGALRVENQPNISPAIWRGPVFEVRLMPRLSYWRYHLPAPLNNPPQDTHFQYNPADNTIVSTRPRPLTKVHVPIAYPPSHLLPSPDKPDLNYDGTRYFSELFL